MDFSTLAFCNPWWDEKSKISNYTFHLVDEYESSSFKRDYNGLFDLSGNNLYIVRGPRQIGKSTLLKFTITNFLKFGEALGKCSIFRWIQYPEPMSSEAFLIQYLQFSRNEKKRYIFIDEITMVDQWQRAVKEVRDNTEMGSDFFALSGSSASDLKRSSERLPGRKGQSGADIVLLPLTFREYLSCKKVDGLPKCRPEEILKWSRQTP
ncbi:AAA family ATPase [Mesotoga sp.]|uniref:ATP-binding protein n=1 Tax=Mesotoga sp. TaxID=2053577 RepID=UPI00345F108A